MIREIIDENIQKTLEKYAKDLGDRSKYVGASDVVDCPRKVVLSKLVNPTYDSTTLIKFKRGHLAEDILAECFALTPYTWETQVELSHPEMGYIKAHVDFLFHNKDYSRIGIVEEKTVSTMPDTPHISWVNQLQFQMGLAKLVYPNAEIKGSIFVMDLNAGKYVEFNGFTPSQEIFDALLERAKEIWNYVKSKQKDNLPVEPGFVCNSCPFRNSCPAFSGDEVPEDVKKAVEEYLRCLEEEKKIKAKKEEIKKQIIGLTGTNFSASFDGHKLTVREIEREYADSRMLKEKYPEVYEDVKRATSYVSLRVEGV